MGLNKTLLAEIIGNTGSLGVQALSILRRYGSDAHVYLPGIGAISGLTANNFTLSDGSTGYAAVDGLDGRVLDAMGGLGSELVTTSFINGDAVAVVTDVGGVVTVTNGDATAAFTSNTSPIIPIVGKTYRIQYTLVTKPTASSARIVFGGNDTGSTLLAGSGTFIYTATTTGALLLTNGSSTTISDFSVWSGVTVKEVTGIHATASGAARPTLRLTGGKYSAEFAGAQAWTLGRVPWAITNDHCVILGVSRTSGSSEVAAFSVSGNTATPALSPEIVFSSSGTMKAYWRNNTAALVAVTGAAYSLNVPQIVSIRNLSGTGSIRTNSVAGTSVVLPTGAYKLVNASIGSVKGLTETSFLTGTHGVSIAIKGTVPNADLLTLERWVASMTPGAPTF